jgi:LemA protein
VLTSVMFWVVVAVLVFWALGAYNRLVGLRAQVLQALQALLGQWHASAQALRDALSDLTRTTESDSAWASLGDDATNWRPLAVATKQLQSCMAGVIAKPHVLPAMDDMASISAAHEVMHAAWQRLLGQQEDLAGSPVPQNLLVLWQHQQMQASEKLRDYHNAAQLYNAAATQFPAVLLAWVFSFQAAQAL